MSRDTPGCSGEDRLGSLGPGDSLLHVSINQVSPLTLPSWSQRPHLSQGSDPPGGSELCDAWAGFGGPHVLPCRVGGLSCVPGPGTAHCECSVRSEAGLPGPGVLAPLLARPSREPGTAQRRPGTPRRRPRPHSSRLCHHHWSQACTRATPNPQSVALSSSASLPGPWGGGAGKAQAASHTGARPSQSAAEQVG